jgi:transcriptional regulator with XRE-family HTH domain
MLVTNVYNANVTDDTSMTAKAIGDRIKAQRMARDWSQGQLAFRAQVNSSHISMVERGLRKPKRETLAKIAGAFGLTLVELLGQDYEEGRTPIHEQTAEELVLGLEGVNVNLYAIKELDPEEFVLIARQLAERREKLEREWREMRNAQRRRSKAAKQAGQGDTKEEPTQR